MGAASLLWPRDPSNRSSISFKRRLQQFAAPTSRAASAWCFPVASALPVSVRAALSCKFE